MRNIAYIGATENGLYLEIKEAGKSRETYRRTNKEETIREYILKKAVHFINAKKSENDLILYTADNHIIVVKDYKQLQQEAILKTLFRRLNRTPILSENLKRNEQTNTLQTLQLRILYANKIKLASLALAGTVLMSGMAYVLTGNLNPRIQKGQDDVSLAMEHLTEDSKDNDIASLSEINPISSLEPEEQTIDIFEFSHRLEQTIELQENYDGYDRSKIMLGARVNCNKIESIFESEMGRIIGQTAISYGIDPYILIAKGLAESNLEHEACCPGGNRYNGYGVGAFQLESPDGRIVKAWNYETESEDSLSITMENATNFKLNSQAAAMCLQNRIDLYNGNPYLALQSYNYGQGMMRVIIHDYAKQMGITEEEVKNNIDDLGWLAIVKDAHQNPNNYYYRVMIDLDETDPAIIAEAKAKYVWKHATYGNPYYLADVLSYYVGLQSQNRNLDGTSTIIDFSNNEIKKVLEDNVKPKMF